MVRLCDIDTLTAQMPVEIRRYGGDWFCIIRFRIFTDDGDFVQLWGGQLTPWVSFQLPKFHFGPARGPV